MRLLKAIARALSGKCKFIDKCELYRKNYTCCNNGIGREYCGKYRNLEKEK